MKISIVAPVFNEEECVNEFYRRTRAVTDSLKTNAEFIFINDGSTDSSAEILSKISREDSRVKVITFSRNFGHQPAIKAGIDHATGDAVVIIDADLQDPPEIISNMVTKWKEGYDVVYAVRAERKGETFFKKATSSLYYRALKTIAHIDVPLDTGDFRLISRPVADALRQITEKKPFFRGLTSWLGFRQTGILMNRDPRFAGKTKYSFLKMFHLAWGGIAHFSFFPLHVATWVGFFTLIFCFVELILVLYSSLVLKITVPGWSSLMVAVLFLGSVQLITLGILGAYLGRNYDESRNRPLYVVQKKEGF